MNMKQTFLSMMEHHRNIDLGESNIDGYDTKVMTRSNSWHCRLFKTGNVMIRGIFGRFRTYSQSENDKLPELETSPNWLGWPRGPVVRSDHQARRCNPATPGIFNRWRGAVACLNIYPIWGAIEGRDAIFSLPCTCQVWLRSHSRSVPLAAEW